MNNGIIEEIGHNIFYIWLKVKKANKKHCLATPKKEIPTKDKTEITPPQDFAMQGVQLFSNST